MATAGELAAALMLGASGVQMGTRFLLAEETNIHQNYKDRVAKASDIDTQVTGRSTGHPVRALRNAMTRQYLKLEKEGAAFEELEYLTLGGLRKAVVDGDTKNGSVMAGQIAGLVHKQQTCAQMIQEIVSEAKQVMSDRMAAYH